jgi:hypothetical protein
MVEEYMIKLPLFTLCYLSLFDSPPTKFQYIKIEFIEKINAWVKKYMNHEIKEINTDALKQLLSSVTR